MLDALEGLGISYADVTALLEREGVDKFEKSWGELLDEAQHDLDLARADVAEAATAVSSLGVAGVRRGGRCHRHHRCPTSSTPQFASKLFAQDATLWGPDAEAESAIRLSWVGPAPRLAPARR